MERPSQERRTEELDESQLGGRSSGEAEVSRRTGSEVEEIIRGNKN
jgi:hypothetical protein